MDFFRANILTIVTFFPLAGMIVLLFLFFLWTRARTLKYRVAELVDVAAFRAGLHRIRKRKPTPVEISPPPVDAAVEMDASVR